MKLIAILYYIVFLFCPSLTSNTLTHYNYPTNQKPFS